MIDLEHELRGALELEAGDAPTGPHLPAAVRTGSARRRLRRRALVGGVCAIVMVASGVGVVASRTGPAPDSPVAARPAGQIEVEFPYTPTEPLAGSSKPSIDETPGQLALAYGPQYDPAANSTATLSVLPERPPTDLVGSPVTIAGRAGRLWERGKYRILIWQHRDGTWLQIGAPLGVPSVAMVRYANGLKSKPLREVLPFTVAKAPPGLRLTSASQTVLRYDPVERGAGGPSILIRPMDIYQANYDDNGFARRQVDTSQRKLIMRTYRRITIEGRAAYLHEEPEKRYLVIAFPDGPVIHVRNIEAPPGKALTRAQAFEFAAGVR